MSELHLYEGTEFEDARDRGPTLAAVRPQPTPSIPVSWLRRATAFLLMRKSYSRA